MIREIMGSKNMSSLLFGDNKRKRRGMTGTVGTMVGIGVAYMAYKSMRDRGRE